ncbi:MAG: hypothetical protein EXS08_08350 [Planctomycetes bacterium]|nr:hypothetical protein [Planctomycetota bacterium]
MLPRTLTCALASLAACRAPQEGDREPRRLAEMEAENVELRQRVATLTEQLEGIYRSLDIFSGPSVCDLPPAIDAEVLSVDAALRLLVLNKGKSDGVKPGYVFDLYRGVQYKGQVKVVDVQDSMCSASILNEKKPIEVGDSATTSL